MDAAALPPAQPRSTRYGTRAPKGGCTVDGRTFRGGQFCLAFDESNPHGVRLAEAPPASPPPPLDITTAEGRVVVADRETGDVAVFRIRRAERGGLAGRRIVEVLVGDEPEWDHEWRAFAFADDFGLKVWARFAGDGRFVGEDGYVAMLTESFRYAGRLEYRVSL